MQKILLPVIGLLFVSSASFAQAAAHTNVVQSAPPRVPTAPANNGMDTTKMLRAECLKTKQKNALMFDAVVTRTRLGGYQADGNDGHSNPMTAIITEQRAMQAFADGVARKGY